MSDPIDPRLQHAGQITQNSLSHSYQDALSLQAYQTQLQSAGQNRHQPYFNLPPNNNAPLPGSQASPTRNLVDPALENPSPPGREASEEEQDPGHELHYEQFQPASTSGGSPTDFKRLRACDSCRGLKVRCDQDANRPDIPCKRCAKANRMCITTPPTRKRQKKADSRVSELEKRIDALSAALQAQKAGVHTDGKHFGNGASSYEASLGALPHAEGSYRSGMIVHDWPNDTVRASDPLQEFGHTQNAARAPVAPQGFVHSQSAFRALDAPHDFSHSHEAYRGPDRKRRRLEEDDGPTTIPEDMDAIHRDIAENPEMKRGKKKGIQPPDHSYISRMIDDLMPPETAKRVFKRYVDEFCPHFPAVPLPSDLTAEEVRKNTPLLFLAIMSSASHGSAEQLVPQDVQRKLADLMKDQFADIIFKNGEKSLEIVQALHVGVLWYRPPLHYEQHNFYMMVNCAAVMALDLGLGRRAGPNMTGISMGPVARCQTNTNNIGSRRTFLVCYYLCMSITMVLRRPILLRWTKYIEESIKILESSLDALPSDRMLCQHVRMAHIGEKVSVEFTMDDLSAEVPIADPEVMKALRKFDNELSSIVERNSEHDVDPSIRLAEHVTSLYIHEIALHPNQSGSDFHPPFSVSEDNYRVSKLELVPEVHVDSLKKCHVATHGILDTILGVPLDTLITLPVIFCVRAVYAVVCLIKLVIMVRSSRDVSREITKESLKIEAYMDALLKKFHAIVTRDPQSPHGKFYYVALRLQERYVQISKDEASRAEASDSSGGQRTPGNNLVSQSAPASNSVQGSINQTPLHLLSEVAMGNGSSAQPTQLQQQMVHPQQPQQFQQQLIQPDWAYANAGMSPPVPDMMAMHPGFGPLDMFAGGPLYQNDPMASLYNPDMWDASMFTGLQDFSGQF
ncbi:hypothetical protein GQ43DRAFT_400040 [Delitschia confertaspora ATCC 74209]|uniref:Zn(2)-C6 fungal-type domain-containing protein n=1 Tax=Delitschia confertaspora ATCC 74209 TaxID=1513339 RepID=A0A9P4JG89_9PLEO|nr:hypothetical protein GQ43DRAFT_400040 [Delitschia confertaspora ATCC 74209]